jgi:putative nucleotidyltransferase with HDIG domain
MQHFQNILRHSSLVNKYIQTIYKKINGHAIDTNYKSAGITHDIGKIILLQYFPEAFDAIIRLCKENPQISFYEHEISIGQAESTHAEIGAYLLDLWNLPEVSVEIALFHHSPDTEKSLFPDVLQSVHLANELVNYVESGHAPNAAHPEMFKYGALLQEEFKTLFSKIAQDIQREKEAKRQV